MNKGGQQGQKEGFPGKGLEKEEEWKQLGWEVTDDRAAIKAVTNKCPAAH